MYLGTCLLALLISVTVSQFHYFKKPDVFRRTDDCQMCYQNTCAMIGTARCDYYSQVDGMLHSEDFMEEPEDIKIKTDGINDDGKIRIEVDMVLHDLVERALERNDFECIPFISRYSDCTKEDISLGCTICDCLATGRWNCTMMQSYQLDRTLSVDHRVLILVMQNLMANEEQPDDTQRRMKRSVTEDPSNFTTNRITFEELSEWLYGVKPLEQTLTSTTSTTQNHQPPITEDNAAGNTVEVENNATTETGTLTTEATTESLTIADSDNLAFEEVLSNIAIDTKSFKRRRLPMDLQNDTIYDVDYIILGENNFTLFDHSTQGHIPNILSLVEDLDDGVEDTKKEANEVVIDLLESAKKNNAKIKKETDFMEIYKENIDANPPFENTNDIIEYDAVNIMKRDVSNVLNKTEITNITEISNATNKPNEHKCHMNDTVLNTLTELINRMHDELNGLQTVKQSLINLVQTYKNNGTVTENRTYTESIDQVHVWDTNTSSNNARRSNQNMLAKHMKKLKRDIYEVLRDMVGIQKHRSTADLPQDIKVLVRAMKNYVSTDGFEDIKMNKIQINKFSNLRRYWPIYRHSTTFKDYVLKILNIMDRYIPESNALHPLSHTAKKLLKKIIKQYYIEDFSGIGFRTHDHFNNLTRDLQNVGNGWQKFAMNIEKSSIFDLPYNMKLLHLDLTENINKMTEALSFLNYTHNRRAIPQFRNMETDIIEKIKDGLGALNNKIQTLIHIYKIKPDMPKKSPKNAISNNLLKKDVENRKQKQKKSFLKQIRNLLRGSKKDIAQLLNKRIPKSEIIKKIAKKKMNELAQNKYIEYEETMKRWQRNLDVRPRKKRSMLDTNGFRARMKNIIPKYLRGKVNVKIDTKKKKTANKTNKPKVNLKSNRGSKSKLKHVSVMPKLTTSARLTDY